MLPLAAPLLLCLACAAPALAQEEGPSCAATGAGAGGFSLLQRSARSVRQHAGESPPSAPAAPSEAEDASEHVGAAFGLVLAENRRLQTELQRSQADSNLVGTPHEESAEAGGSPLAMEESGSLADPPTKAAEDSDSLLQVDPSEKSLCGHDMGQTPPPEVVETPHNSGSNFCTRDMPIDFPRWPFPSDVWMGMRYGKGVSKEVCTWVCHNVNTYTVGERCAIAKYHAQGKYCWLMPRQKKPCSESEKSADMQGGWNWYFAEAFEVKGMACHGDNDGCGFAPGALGLGYGDCDSNADCAEGLVCGSNNCDFIPGWGRRSTEYWVSDNVCEFDKTDDCCMNPEV